MPQSDHFLAFGIKARDTNPALVCDGCFPFAMPAARWKLLNLCPAENRVKPNVLKNERVIYKDTLTRVKGQVVFLPSSQAVIANL